MISPAMEYLADRAYPEMAGAVRAVIESTISIWEAGVRKALPGAENLSFDQLRDDLPKVLGQVADALAVEGLYSVESLVDAAPKHGAVRYDQGFKLSELFVEYSLLRGILVQSVIANLGRTLTAQEFVALSSALDITLRRTVSRFVDHLTEEVKSASEAQSKYLSFLSHDLRGGLNGAFLMIEVLRRELAGEKRLAETLDDLDAMRRSLLETVATMDRFLHAERFRKGKVQINPAVFGLRSFLVESIAHFAYQARDKKVELDVDLPGDLTITSDRELLTLIFQNMISNALKYTRPNTRVTISGTDGQERCTIAIADQGPGIAPERLKDVFNAFSRGETHGQPGVGLGLSIARQAAQHLGAKIWVESEVGKGSTFYVELPKELKK